MLFFKLDKTEILYWGLHAFQFEVLKWTCWVTNAVNDTIIWISDKSFTQNGIQLPGEIIREKLQSELNM